MKGKLSLLVIISTVFCLVSCSKDPMKVVIVTGQNNHKWPVSSVVIKNILDESGLFTTTIATSPQKGEDMSGFDVNFKDYDVVVLDYNGDAWSESMNQNFIEYAQQGGGIIVYHAADNAFSGWEEYNKIIALGGWEGRTEASGPYVYLKDGELVRDMTPGIGGHHGKRHEYLLTRRCNHPVTEALPDQWLHAEDELYDYMRGPGNIKEVLYSAFADEQWGGSGREEPLVFTVDYGKARIMHIMIGHAGKSIDQNPAMDCPGFKTVLIRSAQWCAGSDVTYCPEEQIRTELAQ